MAGFWGRVFGRGPQTFDVPRPAARFSVEVPPELLQFFEDGVVSERRVTRQQALAVPAVMRARNLICGTPATLPIRHIGPDLRESPWPLFEQPNPELPNSVHWTYTYEDLLFESISWWRVTRFDFRGFPMEAVHVPISSVHVGGTPALPSQSQITPDLVFPVDGQVFIDGIPVPDREIIRFDSPNPPLLVDAARAIRTSLLLDTAAALYAKEPMPLGFFTDAEGAETLSTEPSSANDGTERSEADALLDEWETSRKRRAWGYVGGLKPEILQWDPKKLQLAEQRQHAVLEIARATGLEPDYLGVAVSSRTYLNSEQRRQDLIDFTLGGYISAVEDRLSMRDVTRRGYKARVDFGGFLRGDTKTRAETYNLGLKSGMYADADEVRRLENKPPLTEAQKRERRPAAPPQPQEGPAMESSQTPELKLVESARFEADDSSACITFDGAEVAETFRVNADRRTVSGLAVPWGKVARSGFAKWRFGEGSLHWSSETRVKLNLHHNGSEIVGRGLRLQSTPKGLDTTFKVGRGPDADQALQDAEDGLLDGFSVEVDFDPDAEDGWQEDSDGVRNVRSGTLRGVALTGNPAYDDARVTRVAATRDGRKGAMPEDTKAGESGTLTLQAEQFDKTMAGLADKLADSHKNLTESLGESIGDSVTAGVKAALENISAPQDGPEPVRASRYVVTREAPVYAMNGATGPSLVRDAWYAGREHDDDAIERLRKYRQQTEEMAKLAAQYVSAQFAPQSTTSASEIIPPGYRPDLYVPELMQGRPLVGLCSRGTIGNATPFVIPVFGSATGATADHVEGTNPADGTLAFNAETVSPGAVSGRLTLTREIVDSSNPGIDQIALATMRESYNQQTEGKVYVALNGASANTVVYAAASVITDVRGLLADYPFVRFAAPTGAAMNQKVTKTFATTNGSDGRPLLPSVGAENTSGLGNAVNQGWFIDGLTFRPAWSVGDALSDDVALIVNRSDCWVWESPLLSFRYEEKQGPANIELNVFGYFATHVLRPAGIFAVRNPAV